jgi:membrane-associated phospholipid phosphatase
VKAGPRGLHAVKEESTVLVGASARSGEHATSDALVELRRLTPAGTNILVGLVGLSLVLFIGLAMMVAATGGADRIDQIVSNLADAIRTPTLTQLAVAITTLGSIPVLAGGTVLSAAVLWIRARRDLAVLIVASVGASCCAVFLVKVAIARPRPSPLTAIGNPGSDYAFPSGHTTNGSVTWMLVALLLTICMPRAARRAAAALSVLLSLAIGLSRIYLGYHWLTDVLAGWLLATAIVCTAVIVAAPGQPPRGRAIAASTDKGRA